MIIPFDKILKYLLFIVACCYPFNLCGTLLAAFHNPFIYDMFIRRKQVLLTLIHFLYKRIYIYN